jgi:predicted Rdx family selenoprotein
MAEDSMVYKLHVEKLIADGSNWVTYHNHMLWALRSHWLSDHLTSTMVTQTYTNIGTVNSITPEI